MGMWKTPAEEVHGYQGFLLSEMNFWVTLPVSKPKPAKVIGEGGEMYNGERRRWAPAVARKPAAALGTVFFLVFSTS